MPKVTYIAASGDARTIEAPIGENVMRGALYANLDGIVGECGGGMSCATCHVYVDDAWADKVGPRSEMENEMLEMATALVKPTSRLSCQISMSPALDGLIIRMPATQY